MPNHKKPTKEELKKAQEEALTPPEEEEESQPSEEIEEEPVLEEESEEPEPSQEEEKEEAEPSKELYKKKFSDSSREAQKLNAKNRVINKALADAEDVPEPTEEELQKEFSDWDVMSDTERLLARETVVSKRWRELISKAKNQAEKIEKWNQSVADFTEDPDTLISYPELEGKTEEFKEFAIVEKHNNVPMNILVSAFLHDHSIAKKENKGSMFERGKGGEKERIEPSDGKISLEEARKIRLKDYNKWKELLKAGKIKQDF